MVTASVLSLRIQAEIISDETSWSVLDIVRELSDVIM